MLEHLKKLEHLRGLHGRDPAFFRHVYRVKCWQQARLARTYRDLADDSRYARAVSFFLDELYGTKDSALRDRDLIRMVPTMQKLLPEFALKTVEKALELDVLAEEFDQAIARCIGGAEIDERNYGEAFVAAGRRDDRLHQVALMEEVGRGLEVVVRKPFIYSALRMLKKPARVAGLGNMQQFLEAGFTAFRHMKRADHFLSVIAARETALIERLFARTPAPFAIIDEWIEARSTKETE
jgi:hypothetical protein